MSEEARRMAAKVKMVRSGIFTMKISSGAFTVSDARRLRQSAALAKEGLNTGECGDFRKVWENAGHNIDE
jgi:hypothetical protein